jgi:methionine aminopeptidase
VHIYRLFTDTQANRSDPQSSQALVKDDVVKLHIGAHIDGFAAVSAETLVVGASAENPVTGRRADVIKAAWTAAEIAMRTVKVGNKNWAVTEAVGRVTSSWDCKPVEGVYSQANVDLDSAQFRSCRNAVMPADPERY